MFGHGSRVLTGLRHAAAVVAFYGVLAVAFTWPHVLGLHRWVPSHDDPLLSIWRISWIAHALTTGAPLADTNIFHPETRTLAFTDGVLLQGVVATPFIAAGVSPVLVYNVLMLACLALSGAATYLLALRFTGSRPGALLAGCIFAFATFRVDHYMHLELQATVFLPLALYFLDRAFESGRWRDMAGFGAAVVLQVLSGIYYAVFLATALLFALPWRWWHLPNDRRRSFAAQLTVVALAAGVITGPYLWLYVQNRSAVGERSSTETAQWSATPENYLASDDHNLLYGPLTGHLGRAERRLFPGLAALTLAAIGLRAWHARKTQLAIIATVGLLVSFGVNTPIYTVLRDVLVVYRGLRAPARASLLVLLAVAVLAAYGWAAILRRRPSWARAGTAVMLGVLALEYASRPPEWLELPTEPPAVARWLAQQPRSVVLELPLPTADALHTTWDGLYMVASTKHWQPLVNGYSGFHPRSYLRLTECLRSFPSDESIAYLRERQVDLIVIHSAFMPDERPGQWAAALTAHPDIDPVAEFHEHGGPDLVFRLRR